MVWDVEAVKESTGEETQHEGGLLECVQVGGIEALLRYEQLL